MASSFTAAGHRAAIYGQDPVFIAKARQAGLEAYSRSRTPDYNPFAIAWYRRLFYETGVDVVVVNVGKDLRTAGVAARLLGLPVIRRVGAPKDFRDTLQTRMEHGYMHPAFMCCSQYTLDNLIRFVPHVAKYRHVAIHPGTSIPEFIDRPESSPLRLVTTSRLSMDKRHMDLLEALVLLRKKGLIPVLDIVGEGPMRAELEKFCRVNELTEQVTFHGFSPSVKEYLARADIFILPSLREPLGIALEEGMAHGLIPIARAEGGVPEIWPEELEALLVPGNARAGEFADRLETVLGWSKEKRLAVRESVRLAAAEKFSQEKQFALFYEWVQSVMEGHARKKGQAAGRSEA